MGIGIGTNCGVMRRYRCSCFGECDLFCVCINEKLQVWLVWGMALVQSVE